MAIQINTLTAPAFEFPISLGGQSISMRITWNTRTEGWYISVSNSAGGIIERNIKLSPYQPLIIFGIENWSLDGNLFVAPTASETEVSSEEQKIGRDNFGGDRNYQLFYVPRNEYRFFNREGR